MRILLLSANTGEGHNSTAKAVMEVMETQGVECDLRDALACMSPRFSKFICAWHARIYKYGGKLMDKGYRAMERIGPESEETTPVYELLALGAGKLWELLMKGEYDAVVCVHAFAAMMLTEVRRVWGLKVPSYFVATDYTCSPTVEQSDLDGYFIPAEDLSGEFIRAGISSLKLLPSGLPVRQCFYTRGSRTEARKKLGLPQEATVVLIMGGSMGCGPMGKIAADLLEGLPQKAVLVVICGNNERLYEELSRLESPRLRVLGYTGEISDYMDGADMLLTKPGGLSTTEAANKHLPMVLLDTVGGCESRNFSYFRDRELAVGSTASEEAVRWVQELAAKPSLLQRMEKALAQRFQANSAQALTERVLAGANRYRAERQRIFEETSGYPFPTKGGDTMEYQNRETITNLARSFAGEAQARTRYTVYAQVARNEGREWIARIFEETAANEAVHAEEFLEMLKALGVCTPNIDLSAGYPFQLGTTEENLAFAAEGELHEHDTAYPGFAEVARREGFDDAARLWLQIARIEGVHHNTFRRLHEQLLSGTLTEKEEPVVWRCLNCGYTYEGKRACDPCPVCEKNAGWQEGTLDRKQLLPKKQE